MDRHKHPEIYTRVPLDTQSLHVFMYLWEQVWMDRDVVGKKTDAGDFFLSCITVSR